MMDEKERVAQVQRAAGGDGDALQRLIVHYHAPLLGIIDGRLDAPLRRHVDAEDILQQAYVEAFKSITRCTFDSLAGFYRWLERIAVDRLKKTQRDLMRRKRDIRRRLTKSLGVKTSFPSLVERLTSPGSTPSRHLAKREASAAVMSSLARLTDEQREVVVRRFIEDRPVAEIAAELDKTEAAVHMLSYRGLKTLRAALGSITRYLGKA